MGCEAVAVIGQVGTRTAKFCPSLGVSRCSKV